MVARSRRSRTRRHCWPSTFDEIYGDFKWNLLKDGPTAFFEGLEFLSKTTEQTRIRQFVGTVAQEGQFVVDSAGNATRSPRTTISGEAAELLG